MAMYHSSEDMVRFVGEVGLKFPEILPKLQRRGIAIPPSMAKVVKLGVEAWQRVKDRFESGDFRHDASEFKAIAEVAQFLANMDGEMQNRDRIAKGMIPEPLPQLTFDEARMIKRQVTYG